MGDVNDKQKNDLRAKLIVMAAAEKCAAALFEAGLIQRDYVGQIEDELAAQFERGMNGYQFAKTLERNQDWNPDALSVAILDRMEGFCADLEQNFVWGARYLDLRLVEAAPDMLAALRTTEDWLVSAGFPLSLLTEVRGAIAKATGEVA